MSAGGAWPAPADGSYALDQIEHPLLPKAAEQFTDEDAEVRDWLVAAGTREDGGHRLPDENDRYLLEAGTRFALRLNPVLGELITGSYVMGTNTPLILPVSGSV